MIGISSNRPVFPVLTGGCRRRISRLASRLRPVTRYGKMAVQDRLRRDDIFLLCSDGLTKMLEDREIAVLLGSDRPIEISVEMLVDAALDRGATDNVTVVGVQLLSTAAGDG